MSQRVSRALLSLALYARMSHSTSPFDLYPPISNSFPACVADGGSSVLAFAEIVTSGYITVYLNSAPSGSFQCAITSTVWAGSLQTGLVSIRLPSCTGTAVFSSDSFTEGFTLGETYEFVIYGLDGSDIPQCAITVALMASIPADCSTNLEFDRPDAVSISVAIPLGTPVSGQCKVSMTRYNEYIFSDEIVETGPCSSTYFIPSDRKNLSFPNGAHAGFSWSYMFDGVTPTCTSNIMLYENLGGASCFQGLEIVRESVNSFFVGIKSPAPMDGICYLMLHSCGGEVVDEPIQFPSCSNPLEVNLDVIRSVFPALKAGETCEISWTYNYGGESCASGLRLDTPPLTSVCSLENSGSISGQFALSARVDPSTVFALGDCQVTLVSCGDTHMNPPIVKVIGNCHSPMSSVIFDHSDDPLIQAGRTCTFLLSHTGGACGSNLYFTFVAFAVPSWGSNPSYSVGIVGSDCLQISWSPVHDDGGSPVLCYKVWRSDNGSPFYLIADCGALPPGSRGVTSCRVFQGAEIRFKIEALNTVGVSLPLLAPESTRTIFLEFFTVCPTAVLESPVVPGPFSSGAFPEIQVQAPDSTTTDRVFIAQLWNSAMRSIFTKTLTGMGDGLYQVIVSEFVPAGNYQLSVSSLEQGGLQGRYWANAFFAGPPAIDRKDGTVDFSWIQAPVFSDGLDSFYDLVSLRWTGFILPKYNEVYTLTIRSREYVKLFVNEMLVVDSWASRCAGSCSGSIELSGGTFSSVRIDQLVSKGFDQSALSGIQFVWESLSQRKQIVPSEALFKSVQANSGTLQPVQIVPDLPSTLNALVSVSPALVAGSQGTVFIQSRDRFDQNVDSTSEIYTVTLTPSDGSPGTLSVRAFLSEQDGLYEAPFTLTKAGRYTIAVEDSFGGTAVSSNSLMLSVLPASAYSVLASSVQIPASMIAGIPISLSMSLQDIFGNIVSDGSVYSSANWLFDDVSIQRLGSRNDDLLRTQTFGTSFSGDSSEFNPTSKLFTVEITLPLSGTYSVDLTVVSGSSDSPLELPQWTVIAQSVVTPAHSVLVTPLNTIEFVAGSPSRVSIQLRDQYSNCIQTVPVGLTPASPVRAVLEQDPKIREETMCNPNGAIIGMFDCDIYPKTTGRVVLFTVLVNGIDVIYIQDQSAGQVISTKGPWILSVGPSGIHAGNCLVTGLLTAYRLGEDSLYNLTLTLKDQFVNVINSLNGYIPNIAVQFLRSDASVACFLDPFTFSYSNRVDMPVASCMVSSPEDPSDPDYQGWSLSVKINGDPVPVPSWPVRFLPGSVSYAHSTCGGYSVSQTAGVPFAISCDLADRFGNPLASSLVKISVSVNGSEAHTFSSSSLSGSSYVVDANLYIQGPYMVIPTLLQPGGLIAQYFADAIFGQLLYPANAPETDQVHVFTRIDPILEIDSPGSVIIDNISARSIVWTGSLLPPFSQTVRFSLRLLGGLQITLGSALVADFPPTSSVEVTFDYSFLGTDPVNVLIKYVPFGDALFVLRWAYPDLGAPSFSIPSSALLAPLAIPNSVPNPLIVNPGIISSLSFAIISPTIPYIVGEPQFFIIQARDQYGNNIETSSSCLTAGGTAPGCLFEVSMSIQDGTPSPTLTDLGNGQYRVDFTFATNAPKVFNVFLITGQAPADRIPIDGSPYSIPIIG